MRQELIDAFVALSVVKVKHLVGGTAYFELMTQIEEAMTRDEYVTAQNTVSKRFGVEEIY